MSDKKLWEQYVALEKERDALRAKIEQMERQEPVAFGLYSGWALKATYLKEHEACEQRDRRQLTADLGGSLEAYRVAPLYALPGAKPAPSFADAYQGAMEEVAIWKKRALEAEDLNRKFVAEINGPMLMGEPVAQPAPSTPDDVMRDAKRYRFLRAAKNIPISSKAARDPVVYDAAIDAAMLAAAPEAKP